MTQPPKTFNSIPFDFNIYFLQPREQSCFIKIKIGKVNVFLCKNVVFLKSLFTLFNAQQKQRIFLCFLVILESFSDSFTI